MFKNVGILRNFTNIKQNAWFLFKEELKYRVISVTQYY